jgi:hypothetical protein
MSRMGVAYHILCQGLYLGKEMGYHLREHTHRPKKEVPHGTEISNKQFATGL